MRTSMLICATLALGACTSLLGYSEPGLERDAAMPDSATVVDAGTDATLADAMPGPPAALQFSQQPTLTAAGSLMVPGVSVTIVDADGLRVYGATNIVSLALDPNPTAATLEGTLNVQADDGVAVFPNLRLDIEGTGYGLQATSGALTAASSATFDIAGLFSAVQVVTVDSGASRIRAGDLDGDTHTDLVVMHANAVTVLLRDPGVSRGFQTPGELATGSTPNRGLALGDMNLDTLPDIVLASSEADSGSVGDVLVAYQDSATPGTFYPPVSEMADLVVPTSPQVADLNDDGRADIVVVQNISTESLATVGLHSSTTAGVFTAHDSALGYTGIAHLSVGELNGDERPDILYTAEEANTVLWRFQVVATPGTFGGGGGTGYASAGTAIFDLASDGAPDVAAVGSDLLVSRSTTAAPGTFVDEPGLGLGSGQQFVASGDFNRDGLVDLVVSETDGTISVFLEDESTPGDLLAKLDVATGAGTVDLVVIDIDGDAKLDIAMTSASGDSVRIVYGQ